MKTQVWSARWPAVVATDGTATLSGDAPAYDGKFTVTHRTEAPPEAPGEPGSPAESNKTETKPPAPPRPGRRVSRPSISKAGSASMRRASS